jgi:hypothetical protein
MSYNDRFSTGLTHCPNCGSNDHGMCSKVANDLEGFPAGWNADERAPFPTYYDETGRIGVTQDADDTGKWFPIEFDDVTEEMMPMGCEDWSTRPAMHDTPQEALEAVLAGGAS